MKPMKPVFWKREEKIHRRQRAGHGSFVLALIALVLLSGAMGCDQRDDPPNETQPAIPDQLRALESRIQQQQRDLQEQANVLQQILASVDLPSASSEWERNLEKLEGQVRESSKRPKNSDEAARFLERVTKLVTDLPAPAELRYLPRLSPIRWAAMAFSALHPPPAANPSPAEIARQVDELRALAEARPADGAATLSSVVSKLRKRADKLSDDADRRQITEAVAQAKGYLENKPGSAAELAANYELLNLYATRGGRPAVRHDGPGPPVILLPRLYHEWLRRQADEQAAVLRIRWESARKLEHDQPGLHEAAARNLLQQVVSARAALALENVTPSTASDGEGLEALETELRCAVEIVETTAVQRAEQQRALAKREYQRWALGEIRKFEAAPHKKTAIAMVRHLLPIDRALLEHAVHERYQAVFQDGWKKMDGMAVQTKVAEATVRTEKKTLRAFLEKMEKVEEVEGMEGMEGMEEVEEGS